MYLEYVKVKNFGVHAQAEASFEDGFVVVVGKNGEGKSTLVIQAPQYALLGAGTLDSSLDDMVKSGEKVSSLRVEVKYGPYIVTRSKSSASVVGGGEKIVGQEQVSEFFRGLFGIKKKTEGKILVAEQKKVAGILSGKPAEVNTFIEAIAGFYQIDDLLETIQIKFPSGDKSRYEETINNLKDELEKAKATEIEDIGPVEERQTLNDKAIYATEEFIKKIKEELLEIRAERIKAVDRNNEIALEESKKVSKTEILSKVKEDLIKVGTELEGIKHPSREDVREASTFLATIDETSDKWEAQQTLEEFVDLPDIWEGPLSEFESDLSGCAEDLRELNEEHRDLVTKLAVLKSKIVTDTECPTCGTDLKNRYEEINTKLEEDFIKVEVQRGKKLSQIKTVQEELAVLNEINKEHLRRKRLVRGISYKGIVENTSEVPFRYTLDCKPVKKPDAKDIATATEIISWRDKAIKDEVRISTEISDKEQEIKVLETAIKRSEEKLRSLGSVTDTAEQDKNILSTESLLEKKDEYYKDLLGIKAAIVKNIQEINNQIASKNEWVDRVKVNIKDTEILMKKDIRNGKLLQNIRSAKGKVLRAVWDRILVPVGARYSTMVGVPTIVSRTEKGFRIKDEVKGDRPVSRLSGSEETVLGVALRGTLREVFAPGSGSMLWDEPLDGAEPRRAADIIAAIRSLPGQNIMVTHDSDSQITCDQLIEIGDMN